MTRTWWAALVVAVRFGAALEPVEGGPFSTHTYYRTHNRTREALNHTRFSWFEAQTAFQRCYGGEPPTEDRFVYFTSTSALGNSLNIWVHAFLYALYAGRQLVVGRGLVPDLLCGPAGAFVCGVPYRGEAWLNARPHRNIEGDSGGLPRSRGHRAHLGMQALPRAGPRAAGAGRHGSDGGASAEWCWGSGLRTAPMGGVV